MCVVVCCAFSLSILKREPSPTPRPVFCVTTYLTGRITWLKCAQTCFAAALCSQMILLPLKKSRQCTIFIGDLLFNFLIFLCLCYNRQHCDVIVYTLSNIFEILLEHYFCYLRMKKEAGPCLINWRTSALNHHQMKTERFEVSIANKSLW